VEEHDAVGQRDRTRRPGDHWRVQDGGDVEQMQDGEQHVQVAAGDD
jgi:hypothetical protein